MSKKKRDDLFAIPHPCVPFFKKSADKKGKQKERTFTLNIVGGALYFD